MMAQTVKEKCIASLLLQSGKNACHVRFLMRSSYNHPCVSLQLCDADERVRAREKTQPEEEED